MAKKPGEALQDVAEVQLVAFKGITGDRNFGKSRWPGQNLTLIEEEAVDAYNEKYSQSVLPVDIRRNIVTRGIDLNALVGKEFYIGSSRLLGIELCEPCSKLAARLQNQTISKTEVIKALMTSGGLRVNILDGGIISVGMEIRHVG